MAIDDAEPLVGLDKFSVLADGLDHPECVAVGPDAQLYAGGEAGQVYRLDPQGPVEIAQTGGFVLGLCLDADSVIYACDQVRHEVVRIDSTGAVGPYSSPIGVPNYPVFDVLGNLFVSDSGTWDGHDGSLFRITPARETERLELAGVASFPNGLSLSPDGTWLYVVLSQAPGVARVPLRDGQPTGDAELVVELPSCVPDGLATTENGDLLIACYAPDTILHFSWTSGDLRVVSHDPRRVTLAAPTNVAFHGPEREQLAVGSLGRWHVASAPMPFRGAPLNYPRGIQLSH